MRTVLLQHHFPLPLAQIEIIYATDKCGHLAQYANCWVGDTKNTKTVISRTPMDASGWKMGNFSKLMLIPIINTYIHTYKYIFGIEEIF